MFTLNPDQQLFEKTTARLIGDCYPCERIRSLGTQESTFDCEFWHRGAELGWTTLLVPEDAGGGSISGNGLVDLTIVASQFGRHAAPGPLVGTNVVAASLARWGSANQHRDPMASLINGMATATWCPAPTSLAAAITAGGLRATTTSADEIELNGVLDCVEEASEVTYLLASATDESGSRSWYLVQMSAPGVMTSPLKAVDLARRYGRVTLSSVTVPAAARVGQRGAADDYEQQMLDIAATLQSAEMVGAWQRCLEMTLRWISDRYSFGRPLASYQEIKHRIADSRMAIEAGAAVTARAARAVGEGASDASQWANAAMAYVGRVAPESIQDCVQLHGGIGVTSDHDLHLFLRRVITNAQMWGTPADAAATLVDLIQPAQRGAK